MFDISYLTLKILFNNDVKYVKYLNYLSQKQYNSVQKTDIMPIMLD